MITFTVTFHGPFHVGTGNPEAGMDRPVDRGALLPATSLKGLMRAEAAEILGVRSSLIAEIFGQAGLAGAWWWEDASVEPVPGNSKPETLVGRAARIVVGDNGVVEDGFLVLGEHVWSERATFRVGPLRALAPETSTRHTTILRAAARSVTALGGARRRGEGWVSITDDTGPWTDVDTRALLACRRVS